MSPPDENLLLRMRNSSTRPRNRLWGEKNSPTKSRATTDPSRLHQSKAMADFQSQATLVPSHATPGRRPTLEKATCVADRGNCRRFSYRCASLIRRRIAYVYRGVSMRIAGPSSISSVSYV
ncbi:hypothetical protein HN011_000978 [Eciton burchellii]|nr:hypothetical protein HN011_000978 [Eciton burchellii]